MNNKPRIMLKSNKQKNRERSNKLGTVLKSNKRKAVLRE